MTPHHLFVEVPEFLSIEEDYPYIVAVANFGIEQARLRGSVPLEMFFETLKDATEAELRRIRQELGL